MRRFLLRGHTQSTDPALSLEALTGAGRIDVLARAITAAFCVSHGIRTDTEVWVVTDHEAVRDGPRTVRLDGAHLRSLNPDERSTVALLRKAFAVDVVPNGHFETAHPGIGVALMGFEEALGRFAAEGPVVLLDRSGDDIRTVADATLGIGAGASPGFLVSDHLPWTDAEKQLIEPAVAATVRVGDRWLQGNAAVTLVQDELDRRAP